MVNDCCCHCGRRHRRYHAGRHRDAAAGKSTIFTGGIGNPVIATGELGGAVLVTLLALAAPLAALAAIVAFFWLAIRLRRRWLRGARPS